jgi:hypothetical protein
MRLLSTVIARHLETNSYCIVSEVDLVRVWPIRKGRAMQIRLFANERDWHLVNYVRGYGAIIAKRI